MDGDNQRNIAQRGKPGKTPCVLGMNDVRLKLPHRLPQDRGKERKILRQFAAAEIREGSPALGVGGKAGEIKGKRTPRRFPAENITGNMRMPGSISTGRFSGKMTQTSCPRLRRCSAMFLV